MPDHSPGPWSRKGAKIQAVIDGWAVTIARVETFLRPVTAHATAKDKKTALANARLIASAPKLKAENDRLKGLLDQAWDASGLLCARMTGQPDQAYEEPNDLIDQIAELAEKASARDEAEQETEELRADNTDLRAELRAIAESLADALSTPDRARREALLELSWAKAKNAAE